MIAVAVAVAAAAVVVVVAVAAVAAAVAVDSLGVDAYFEWTSDDDGSDVARAHDSARAHECQPMNARGKNLPEMHSNDSMKM